MTILGVKKQRLAGILENEALRAEAHFSLVDAGLSGSVLVGLVLNWLVGWWWSDAASALVVAAFALREGIEGLRERASSR